jgi:hypothetical protein
MKTNLLCRLYSYLLTFLIHAYAGLIDDNPQLEEILTDMIYRK